MESTWMNGLHAHLSQWRWFKFNTATEIVESQATSPLTDEARVHSASDHDQIKAIIEPYWHIFNMCLRQFEVPTIGRIDFRHPPKASPDKPTIITVGFMRDRAGKMLFATGADAFPPLLSLRLQAGISKLNMCDASIHLFFEYIRYALQDIGATLEWLVPTPNPRIVFHYSCVEPDPQIRHSLFAITTRHGNKFAADFTIEQFGFEADMWFQTQQDYLDKCTWDNKQQTADLDELIKRDERQCVGMDRVVQRLCGGSGLVKWKDLDADSKVGRLERLVREACSKEFEDDKGEKRAPSWSDKFLAKP